jgi:methyl-accepting chemotaxis protein
MTLRLSIAQRLALGFSVGPVILVIVGWVAYSSTSQLLEARNWYSHTLQILKGIEAVSGSLFEAQSRQRGYLLTGDERFLEGYRDAAASVGKDLDSVAALTAENPKQQARLQALRPLVATSLDQFGEAIQLRKNKGVEAALGLIETDQAKRTRDNIQSVLDDIENEETDLLKKREADTETAAAWTFATILYGTGLSVVLLAIISFLITRSITVPVRDAVNALASSTSEVLAGTAQQAAGAQEQAAAVTQTMTTVDEIAQTSEQANERAKAVAEASRHAVEVGTAGRKAVENSIVVMGGVKEQTESIAQSVLGLAEQAQAIGEIIAAVTDIAEQTNLLALNAAIEASRAGEHGRGFSVVASEIKALADQSKKATSQVRQILGEIQRATNGAVIATEEGTKSVNGAIQTARQAGDTIKELADTITDSARAAVQITASVAQQTVGIAQIQQAMQSINQATSQNLASTRQAEQAAKDLDALGLRLKNLLIGAAA